MNKYVFGIISSLIAEIKQFGKTNNLDRIKDVLNNEITSTQCKAVVLNDSTRADAYYGLIVFPHIILNKDSDEGLPKIESYVIELQKTMIDELEPNEVAAMIIHDISHNILTTTVSERIMAAVFKACSMTHTKIVEIIHNITPQMYNLAVVDIANRTYKAPVVPGTDMYEPDRLLVDMEITDDWNSALKKVSSLDVNNLTLDTSIKIGDEYTGSKIVKMIQEKVRKVTYTYNALVNYIGGMYDTSVLTYYPSFEFVSSDKLFGEDVSGIERLKPFEQKMLTESTIHNMIRHMKDSAATLLIESSISGKDYGMARSVLQKEFDVIQFKMDELSSNYERLALLETIYNNIFAIEKYLDKFPDNSTAKEFLTKFIKLTSTLKDTKISPKRYDVFVEVPAGYEG